MNSPIHIAPVIPLYLLLPTALVLALLLGWQESRKPYRFKILRVMAQALALLALLAMTLRPSRDIEKPAKEVVLLTSNYSRHALDSLLKLYAGLEIVRAPGVAPVTGADSVSSFRGLLQHGQIRFVMGNGIPVPFLDYVKGQQFQLIPGRPPAGVVELQLTNYPAHRKNWLAGKIRGGKGSRLTLVGPGGAEDSVIIRTNTLTSFELGFSTKAPGQYVYGLNVKDSTGKVTAEEVPIAVVASRQLSILLIQDYPQAEVRFLKNYLTEKNHRLVTRYRLSRNIFRYEVANGALKPSDRLDEEVLNRFDLVVADDESLKSLSPGEIDVMETAVRRGMGVLVLLNNLPEATRFPGDVLALKPVTGVPDTIRYSLGNFGSHSGPFVAVKHGPRVQAILRSGSYLLQGLTLCGAGKVSCQSLRETYRLALAGDQSAFAALWTPLLEQTARREDVSSSLHMTSTFPRYPGDPVTFDLIGSDRLNVAADSIPIPLMEDVLVDELWHGRFWAGHAGWRELTTGDASVHYFVARPGSWQSWKEEVQRRENELISQPSKPIDSTVVHREEFPRWVFFVAFVVAMGFIWLAPKL